MSPTGWQQSAQRKAEGRKAIRCPGDIRSEETCQKIIDIAVEQLGGIDVLVNNAAYQMTSRPSSSTR